MEFTTEENGAKVVINAAPLADAFKLKASVEKALLAKGLDIVKIADGDIVSAFMALDSSEEVYQAMFDCLKKSTYNNQKITLETFEPEDARKDLYDVFFYCLKVNVYPFFKGVLSRFGIRLEKITSEGNPQSK